MRTTALLFAFLAAASVAGAVGADPEVTATLEPSEIRLGESAELSLTISTRQRADSVALPGVDGLDFEDMGQSSSYRVVNGVVSGSTTFHVRVTARRVGTFAIPAIEARVGSRSGRSEPLELKVIAGAAPRPPSARAGSRVETRSAGDPAFLTVTPGKRDLYVGERVPVEIRACFRDGQRASIRSLPKLEGDAFTLETTDKEPLRSELTIDGERYVALTWEGALSAVKEGDHGFEASLDATLVLPFDRAHPRRPRSPLRADPFGDDFFDSAFEAFFDAGREEDVTLHGDPLTFHVTPLPAEGKPAGFAGAVGHFRLDASASPTAIAAGEPMTLTMTVEGEGNFARVTAPSFPATPGWKSYPAKASFTPADSSGAEGTKSFEQPIVPRGGDVKEIPPVAFSYFDPERAEYVTLRTEAIPIQVSGAPVADAPDSSAGRSAVAPPGAKAEAPSLQRGAAPGTRSLRPMWEGGRFRYGLLAVLAAFAAGVVTVRLIGRGPRPMSLRRLRAKTDRAIAQSDAPRFFAVCREAVQERIGQPWGVAPRSITLAEMRQRGAQAELCAFFDAADAVAYSGRTMSQEEMRGWQERVLARLEEER